MPGVWACVDLEQVARCYQPAGCIVPPASFARDGVSLWTLAKLVTVAPIPPADRRALDEWLGVS